MLASWPLPGAKLGVRYVLVVRGGAGKPMEANLLLEHLMGAEIHPLETMDRDETNQEAERIGRQLQEEGYTPYVYHQQPFARVAGTIGYLEATVELAAQLAERDVQPDYIYGVAGTSMAGIALATKLLGYPWKVRAISSGDRRNLGNMMLEYGQEVQGSPRPARLPAAGRLRVLGRLHRWGVCRSHSGQRSRHQAGS